MKNSRPYPLFACRIFVGCSFLLGAATLATLRAEPEVVDGIAAQVNSDVITFSEVRDLVSGNERSIRSNYTGQELVEKVRQARKAALQTLIDRKLILQEFKKKEYAIPDSLIDDRVATVIREEYGGDRQAFVRTLLAQGMTQAKFREQQRDMVIVQAMRYQNVKSNLLVSPLKLDSLYTTNKPDYTTPEQIHLWMISITKGTVSPGSRDGDPQKAVADEIRDKLNKGGKFEQLASLYSEDSSRQAGGDWGWIDRKTLNETLSNAAFKLDVNKISPVLAQGNSYYILKVSERKSAFTKPLSDVRVDLEKKISAEDRARQNEEWLTGLRAKAFIKTF